MPTMLSAIIRPLLCADNFRIHCSQLCARFGHLWVARDVATIAVHAGRPSQHFLDDTGGVNLTRQLGLS